eukprot:TRINITY_DN5875_c0_g1_i1.p1 TRINITY_DN5875_c0_g1~~TRINITY_DN5875_c0_g1_i1.p1  ORF type:complete len:303 (-),score=90.07 TRINITY_DN5875_c0_g1_i1:316-1224(-)
MGICKCKKKTDLFCFVHKKAVCENCVCTDHKKCVVKTYVEWLTDSEYEDPSCFVCKEKFNEDGNRLRLLCMHLFHPECLDVYASSLPPHTAKAGFQCPECSKAIFPPPDNKSNLASEINDHLRNTSWSKHLISASSLSDQTSSIYQQANEVAISIPIQSSSSLDRLGGKEDGYNNRKESVEITIDPNNEYSSNNSNYNNDFGVASRKPLRDSQANIFEEDEDKYKRRGLNEFLVTTGIVKPTAQSKGKKGGVRLNMRNILVICIVICLVLGMAILASSGSEQEVEKALDNVIPANEELVPQE